MNRTTFVRPAVRTPVVWRLRHGWPAEAQAEAVAATRPNVNRARNRIRDLEEEVRLLEELVDARARASDAGRPRRR